ncbi:MAG: oligoribonuclease [Mariprofundales bacterium]|nr:oligoribonuclease [Mariprofundales bacterium]
MWIGIAIFSLFPYITHMSGEPTQSNLIWMDLEMTGLDPESDTILEIATVVTDGELNVLATGPELVVHHHDATLAAMDAWCQEHHGASGLIERVRNSAVSMADAEAQTLAFIQRYADAGAAPLCGNSIHQDRRFLVRYMPQLNGWLHYRNIDVSTVKELVARWYGTDLVPKKAEAHRALGDIEESIAELRHYRHHTFR